MRRTLLHLLVLVLFTHFSAFAENRVRGLSIAAPAPAEVDDFVLLMETRLSQAGVNTLVLRIDFGYEFTSHPELRDNNPLSASDVTKIADAARRHNIRIIPQINLLGHQSWANKVGKLLEVYPEFDETPGIQIPEVYSWPNDDGLYCKSYCPQHPDVHKVVFALVDEILDAFGADAFHAGMDEVFYIAHPDCPRCQGHDPAELFAGEVTRIRNHLAQRKAALWIWGDRLIDGKTTGIGLWEGSYNNTHRAIDLIPRDVVICDWHYEKAHPTPVLFASKGYTVVASPWNKPEVGLAQVEMLEMLRGNASEAMRPRFAGILHTYWSSAKNFMDGMLERTEQGMNDPSVKTFRQVAEVW